MATITTDSLARQEILPYAPKSTTYTIASWRMGSLTSAFQVSMFGLSSPFLSGSSAVATQTVYRGKVGTAFVYSVGTPPGGGAVDIAIVGSQ